MRKPLGQARVAVVHEWLVDYSGSERCVEQILNVFPDADLFAVIDFLPPELRGFIRHKRVTTTFIQKLPRARTRYRQYLPLMPAAIARLDVSAYDLVITSSHAVAKGVRTRRPQVHLSYVYSPMRYAWDLQEQYLKESGLDRGMKGWFTRRTLAGLRAWDRRKAKRVDRFVAISNYIADRIRRAYGRDASVVYPPVDVETFALREAKEDFYVTASRMVPYKRVDLVVEAFASMPDKRLVVIGDGPDWTKVRARAGPNVKFLGFLPTPALRDHVARARAFVFAAEEDFGIAPLEAQACGTPVIAFGRGGCAETIRPDTGVLFPEQTAASIRDAIAAFERAAISPRACRDNAMRFTPERFRAQFRAEVESAWTS